MFIQHVLSPSPLFLCFLIYHMAAQICTCKMLLTCHLPQNQIGLRLGCLWLSWGLTGGTEELTGCLQ